MINDANSAELLMSMHTATHCWSPVCHFSLIAFMRCTLPSWSTLFVHKTPLIWFCKHPQQTLIKRRTNLSRSPSICKFQAGCNHCLCSQISKEATVKPLSLLKLKQEWSMFGYCQQCRMSQITGTNHFDCLVGEQNSQWSQLDEKQMWKHWLVTKKDVVIEGLLFNQLVKAKMLSIP